MKRYITLLLSLCAVFNLTAQSSKADTTKLSVYNTGMRFTLTQADFGGKVTQSLMADMVMVYDTIISLKETGNVDTSGRKPLRYVVDRICDKPLGDLKGKVALMELNKDCDVTLMCLRVQKAGAKALVIIHNSNSNGNIKLPKLGVKKDSVTIPIFTVGSERADSIKNLLPTTVGIYIPPVTTQNLTTNNNIINPKDKAEKALNAEITTDPTKSVGTDNGSAFSKPYLQLSPNPTHDVAYLSYGFPQATDMQIEIKNAIGQIVYVQQLRGASIGTLELNTINWSNNIYIVEMSYGKERIRQKLVVQK